jgi:hypothetical protein
MVIVYIGLFLKLEYKSSGTLLGATFSTGKVIHKFGKHWLGYI